MFFIDPLSRVPIYEQIVAQTERLILHGLLRPGDQIPSVRSLSIELKTNPNTIQKAYAELDDRGLVRSVPGKGCFVCEGALALLRDRARARLAEIAAAAAELKLAGVGREEVIGAIDAAYGSDDERKDAKEEKK